MKAQIKLGRIAGISIGLHYSWFIIAMLIALSLAQHFRTVMPPWSTAVVWTAALIRAIVLRSSSYTNSRTYLAKARGLRVRGITLFALWCVADRVSLGPQTEF